MVAWTLISAISLLAVGQTTPSPSVQLQLDTRVLDVGESVEARVVCTNTGEPTISEAAVPDGLKLQLLAAEPMRSSQVSIINGRRSERSSYTFRLLLTGEQAGQYELGAIRVQADGQTYETQPVRITVRETPATSAYVFVELEVEPREVFVTQTFIATLRLGIRDVEIGGQRVEMDPFRELIDYRASQFSIFQGESGSQRRTWRTDPDGQKHLFTVIELRKEVRADEVGELAVGPIFVRVNYPTSLARGWFNRYEVRESRKETARADAITVTVQAPPADGRPASYTGAIGRYAMQVTASPTEVELGQPITLSIALRGQPLEGVPSPDLAALPELVSRFDFSNDELVGQLESGAKVFRRAVFPKQAGEQTIPPVQWSYFDVPSRAYHTLTSEPITINVNPPAPGATPLPGLAGITGSDQSAARNRQALTMAAGGMSPNYVDVAALLAQQQFVMTPVRWSVAGSAPVAWLAVTLLVRRRRRLRHDRGWARRRRARHRADQAVRAALAEAGPAPQLASLGDALTDFVLDRFNLSAGQRTAGELGALLTERGASAQLADELSAFLARCEAARYAPSTVDPAAVASATGDVRRWLRLIEEQTS